MLILVIFPAATSSLGWLWLITGGELGLVLELVQVS